MTSSIGQRRLLTVMTPRLPFGTLVLFAIGLTMMCIAPALAIMVLAFAFAEMFMTMRLVVRAFWQLNLRAAAENGHCGVCWYELRNLKAASDGCVVCPECGNAWRINPSAGTPADATSP